MVTIRPVVESDAATLLALAKQCPPLDVHTPYTYWTLSRYFGGTSFVAEVDGRAVGFITSVVSGSTLFVWQIGLLAEHRGSGAAGSLLEAVHRRAVELGLSDIETTITASNGPSNGLFRAYAEKYGATIEVIDEVVVPEHEDLEPEVLFRIRLA
jgi:L-2,4-diaminobutyric acid acetyltransferase